MSRKSSSIEKPHTTTAELKPRVLLIDPPDFINCRQNNLQLPLGLIALYNYLRQTNMCEAVHVVDLSLMHLQRHDATCQRPLQILKESPLVDQPWDIIGITTHFTNTIASLAIAKYLKKRNSKATVVFGGLHATSCYRDLLRTFPYIDLIILGEGELGLAELCKQWKNQCFDFSTIPNAAYVDSQDNVVVGRSELLSLAEIEPYDFSCVLLREYVKYSHAKSFWLESGRGCVFRCGFCISAKHWGNRSRYFEATKIVSDLKTLHEAGIHHVKFTHDQFTCNKRRVREICCRILDSGLAVKWGCYSRVAEFPFELLDLMTTSGCRQIFIGLESTSIAVQDSLKKLVPTEKLSAVLDACNTHGIELEGNVILGFPQHDEHTILDELVYCANLKRRSFGRLSISPLQLYPSTEFFYQDTYRRLFKVRTRAHEQLQKLFSFRFEHRKKFYGLSLPLLAECFRVLATYFPTTIAHILSEPGGCQEFSRWIEINNPELSIIHAHEDLQYLARLINLIISRWGPHSAVANILVVECAMALVATHYDKPFTWGTGEGVKIHYDGKNARVQTYAVISESGSLALQAESQISRLILYEEEKDMVIEQSTHTNDGSPTAAAARHAVVSSAMDLMAH